MVEVPKEERPRRGRTDKRDRNPREDVEESDVVPPTVVVKLLPPALLPPLLPTRRRRSRCSLEAN